MLYKFQKYRSIKMTLLFWFYIICYNCSSTRRRRSGRQILAQVHRTYIISSSWPSSKFRMTNVARAIYTDIPGPAAALTSWLVHYSGIYLYPWAVHVFTPTIDWIADRANVRPDLLFHHFTVGLTMISSADATYCRSEQDCIYTMPTAAA